MLVPRSFTDGKHKPLPCILPCSLSSMLFFFLLILLLLDPGFSCTSTGLLIINDYVTSGYSLVSNRLLLLLDPGPGFSCTSMGLLIAHY